MGLIRRFRKSLVLFSELLIILSAVSAFAFVWTTRYPQASFLGPGKLLVLFAYFAFLLIFGSLFRAFKIGMLGVHELVYGSALSAAFTNVMMYMVLCLIARNLLDPLPLLPLTLVQTAFFWVGMAAANSVYYSIYKARRILTVFEKGSNAGNTIRKMRAIKERYSIEKGITTDCPFEAITAEIDKFDAVLVCDCQKDIKNQIIEYCYKNGKRIYVQPSPTEIVNNNMYLSQISDTPILVCRNRGFSTEQKIFKRAGDIFFSGLAVILLGPLMLAVAVAIRAYDGGPVLYRQTRLTEGGREFDLLKFRSMIVNAERSGAQLAKVNDERITPVGRVIRSVRLDELPQLFNILKGDMSLVGPRPERPEITEEYKRLFPQFEYRLKVKAGLTGYAQVFGKYNTTPMDKLNMDLCYIERHSLLLDVKLLIMTFKILFMKESTEGTKSGRPDIKK